MSKYTSILSFFRTIKFFSCHGAILHVFPHALIEQYPLFFRLCLDISVINGVLILHHSIFSPFPSTAVSTILDLAFAFAISYLPFSFFASFSAICYLIKSDCSASNSASFVFYSIDFVLEFSDLLLQLNLFEAGVKIALAVSESWLRTCFSQPERNIFTAEKLTRKH